MSEDFITDELFWMTLDKAVVFEQMGKIILTCKEDLDDLLSARAFTFINKGRLADMEGWRHFYSLNPEIDKNLNFTANCADRKVRVA